MHLYFVHWVIIHWMNIYFDHISPNLATGTHFKLLLCPLYISRSFGECFLTVTCKIFQAYLVFTFSPSPKISWFLKEILVLFSEMWYFFFNLKSNWSKLKKESVLNFLQSFSYTYWYYHMIFIFQLVTMVYHIDWFAHIKESLNP